MKLTTLITFTLVLMLLTANAIGGGAADKVTGDFTIISTSCNPDVDPCVYRHRILSAHEETGIRHQRGFFFSWLDDGAWFEMDFTDTENTCVNVYADGRARMGGLVSDGTHPAVGKYFGLFMQDNGAPGAYTDETTVLRFNECTLDNGYCNGTFISPKDRFFDWCAGEDNELFATHWFQVLIQGNLRVKNGDTDED